MSQGNYSQIFRPGEPVFLQGETVPDYFKVLSGRFAKVRSERSADEVGMKAMLSDAELLSIVTHQELFGEIEALMGKPQPFSVFALDESKVFPVPAENSHNMKEVFSTNPKIGVKTCISFAKFLKKFFSYFTKLSKEEVEIDSFLRASARDYLAVLNELKTISGSNRRSAYIAAAENHSAFSISNELVQLASARRLDSSVKCGIVRGANREIKVKEFSAGSLLCKKNTIGDRLYIITEGVAEVIIGGNNPNIKIGSPGSIIGEIAVFLNLGKSSPDIVRTADVVCATKVSAIVLHLDQVESFFAKQPEIMIKMLMAMVDRTEKTKLLCFDTEQRLRIMLYDKLGVILEGLNDLSHSLASKKENLSLSRPFTFCTHRARSVYDRLAASIRLLNSREMIKT